MRRLWVLVVAPLLTLFLVVVTPPVRATDPPLSASGRAVVDGSLSPAEWSSASTVSLQLGTIPATFMMMNDDRNLYVAAQYEAPHEMAENVSLAVEFDGDGDGTWPEANDDVFVATRSVDFLGATTQFGDDHRSMPPDFVYGGGDVAAGGTSDGGAASSVNGGVVSLEASHPLRSGDSRDVAWWVGSEFGVHVLLRTFDMDGTPVDVDWPIDPSQVFGYIGFADAVVAPPPPITLTGVARDFQHASPNGDAQHEAVHVQGSAVSPATYHPDFEMNGAWVDGGIVDHVLGTDGKPVYGGPTWTTHGAALFDQWFRTVPGINVPVAHDVTLTYVPGTGVPGVPLRYAFDSEPLATHGGFFPVDGRGWNASTATAQTDNDGHNYSFTYELHSTFIYEPGQTFTFEGDDDVFVFIDRELVVDLGGVHTPMSASVDLDTLNLVAGERYALDVFFAERHTGGSKFSIDTSILLEPDVWPMIIGTTLPAAGAVVPVGVPLSYAAEFIGDTNNAPYAGGIDDGTSRTPGVTDNATQTFTGAVTFSTPGVYPLELYLADGAGTVVDRWPVQVVAYDPSAGFVTGGGWYISAPGSSRLDPTATGKTTFGFVSKYKKGMAVPTGETEFVFHAGGLRFHSDQYQWLIVSGDRAQYRGAGMLNGQPGYGFTLTARDGGRANPDMVRIKVTDAAGLVVYDNTSGTDVIGQANLQTINGTIVLHK